MRRCFQLVLFTVVLVASALVPRAHAGPWTPEPLHGSVKLWTKWLLGIGYSDSNGARLENGSYHEVFWSAYGELGIVKNVALWLHAPVLRLFVVENASNRFSRTCSSIPTPVSAIDS